MCNKISPTCTKSNETDDLGEYSKDTEAQSYLKHAKF